MKIVYCSGKTNLNADALSRSPVGPAPVEGPGQNEVQVSAVSSDKNIESLLDSVPPEIVPDSFSREQQKLKMKHSVRSSNSLRRVNFPTTRHVHARLHFSNHCLSWWTMS